MRRTRLILTFAALLALGPVLGACESFDMDSLDIFHLNEKKKLPGERRAVFPEGVPGVSQGVPPELIKGNAPPPEAAQTAPEPEPAEAAEAEPPKPKPKVVRKPKPRVAAQPAPAQQPAAQSQAAQPAQNAQQPGSSPWPSSPAPGTFQR